MPKFIPHVMSRWNLMLCCAVLSWRAFADPHPQQIHVDGLTVHWGVVSAEKAEGNPEVGPPVTGAVKDKYHLVVAVFDQQSGERIANAKVSAKVGRIGHWLPPEKELHLISANGVVSYGNYFAMATGKTQTISVQVARPDVGKAVSVKFRYQPK